MDTPEPGWLPPGGLDRHIARVAIAAAVIYFLLLDLRPYPGDVLLKSALCPLLALLAWRAGRRPLAAAFLCSAAGDAFLGIDDQGLFVPGLGSFLITHLLYIWIFLREAASRPAAASPPRRLLTTAAPLAAAAYAALIIPKLGPLLVPVVIYMSTIVVMVVAALRVAGAGVPLGALLFLLSDSLIALEKFLLPAAWIGPAIWATYAMAQLSIAHGLLVAAQRDRIGTTMLNDEP